MLLKWNNDKTNWTKSSYIGYRFREVQQYTCSGVYYYVGMSQDVTPFSFMNFDEFMFIFVRNWPPMQMWVFNLSIEAAWCRIPLLCVVFFKCSKTQRSTPFLVREFGWKINLWVKTDMNAASFNRLVWRIVIWCWKYSNNQRFILFAFVNFYLWAKTIGAKVFLKKEFLKKEFLTSKETTWCTTPLFRVDCYFVLFRVSSV